MELLINGKLWGEFETCNRDNGRGAPLEITGFKAYEGTHSVRVVGETGLSSSQVMVLEELQHQRELGSNPVESISSMKSDYCENDYFWRVQAVCKALNATEQAEVIKLFAEWVLEQEDNT